MQEKSMDLHELRKTVSARDKALIGSKPFAEAVKLVREHYGVAEEAAAAFVSWQQTIASGGETTTRSNPTETWHLKFDEAEGKWLKVPQPGDPTQ